MKPTGTNTTRLYGLPKVHKPGLPLRPVLDMYNSPFHGTAKLLVKILGPLHREIVQRRISDVFDFISKRSETNVRYKRMLSMDVSSLFTNVPLMETVDYICQEITDRQLDLGIPLCSPKKLLLKCTTNVHFFSNNLYYRQVDEIAMGSPLGPILADFFLAKLANVKLKDIIKEFDVYCRYVDDIFILADGNCC
uniref:Reverse transcriptase domain-containing protein n=1 Tax=Trichobilharzia regenti TaxID=157069 RepID=A0AA85K921_TRIRE|nr:unnamed protein product [Trichobilharzia regenti]